MITIIIRWLILTLAVWAAAQIIPGIQYDMWQSLLITSLILGILNVFVKPILMLVSLPLIALTLGLFLIFLNALLLKLTSWLVPGFHIAGFWSALGGGLVISIVSFFFGRPSPCFRVRTFPSEDNQQSRRPPPGKGPIIDV